MKPTFKNLISATFQHLLFDVQKVAGPNLALAYPVVFCVVAGFERCVSWWIKWVGGAVFYGVLFVCF